MPRRRSIGLQPSRTAVVRIAGIGLALFGAALGRAAATPTSDSTAAKKVATWDVQAPPGPTKTIALDTRAGTWMSVDVSPDGRELVFDLLGDLYTMPIAGGDAKPLTSGLAWDEHPRYSPDGTWIAFTSDRGGGDNIWIVRRDGSDARPVTRETFRLFNSPVWTPDGEYIAARKHFTSTRSLGAGEIWLVHRTGGKGLQMTKRPNDQKDLGEPAFSPDGRYLYFSQDVTPGNRFEYNKDPNKPIYAIQRLDRETGRIERFVHGPGGAIRPTPSPDGKLLAFIRRVRGKSILHVMDVRSGAIRPVYDGLDRDLQETWAVHGVYPQMAWTPDSREVVFWAGGGLHRVDVTRGRVRDIPFHVQDTRTILERVYSERRAAPARFHTRMLRGVRVAPDGKRVVFEALGHLYVRDLPDGRPRRLTRQDDHLEAYPAWSRDGKSIVYVTWDDADLGAVRIVPARGGKGRLVTPEPGHYIEPVFSPDGRRVVFRKLAGGFLRSPLWSHDPGIYWAPVGGGAMHLVTRDGFAPQFGARNDRVFLMDVGGSDRDERRLFSIDLDGSDARDHVSGVYFTEIQVSPDERWLAFAEGFQAYVTPLVATGRGMKIGPGQQNVPVHRVSRDAGEYLHWAGDSRGLYWTLGPELFHTRVDQVFPFLPGAPEKPPAPPAHGIDIGFDVTADVPEGRIALVGGRIVTVDGGRVIESGTVLVEGNRIVDVGPQDAVRVPAGTHVVDVQGKTLVPGFVDVHWHGAMGMDELLPEQNGYLYASLAFGVTTIHDPSNDTSEIFAASEMQRAGLLVGPRIFSTGTILYGAKGSFKAEIDSLADARRHLKRMQAVGAFSVKSYNQPRRDQRQQVLAAARELGMLVMPEGGSLFQHNMNMVVDGHTGIEHSVPLARLYDDVLQLWSGSGVAYTPTLVVGYGGLWGENYWYGKTRVWANERLARFVPRPLLDARARRAVVVPDEEYGHFYNAREAKRLHDAGVGVQIGAHGQREGLAAHWEMWMLAQGGMTPAEVLQVATLEGARYLGMQDDLGSITPGKLADLVVLDSNPLANIRNTESVHWTMINGRLYDTNLDEVGNRPRARQPFYWEREGSASSPLPPQSAAQRGHGCTCTAGLH